MSDRLLPLAHTPEPATSETAFTKVVDAEKAVLASGDTSATVYKIVQFAIREAVATRRRP
jgi:hypothetical protein